MTAENAPPHVRSTSAGWMINRLGAMVNRALVERLAPHGLSQPEFALLMILLAREGQTQTEIGRSISLPGYAMTRTLDALEDKGLVERRASPTSRRANHIYPTEAGRALGPTLLALVGEVNAILLAPLPEAERATFAKALTRLVEGHGL